MIVPRRLDVEYPRLKKSASMLPILRHVLALEVAKNQQWIGLLLDGDEQSIGALAAILEYLGGYIPQLPPENCGKLSSPMQARFYRMAPPEGVERARANFSSNGLSIS
ncbi:MAG: hypothetical protein LBB15_00605 [Puniceicoccales bacterium]|jgi:hypothetical protein|nr:hypothetical protein [Puniceicoccales bacterium]